MRKLPLLLTLILLPLHAQAADCPQGQTASGACVDPQLAKQLRRLVLMHTQAKLSYTAPPWLPSDDGAPGTQPAQAYEIRALYTFPAPASVNPRPVRGGGGPGPIGTGGGS